MSPLEGIATQTRSSDFFNKVMAWFGLSILATGAGVYLGFHTLLPIFAKNPSLMFGLFILELGLILTSRWWSTKKPLNFVLFSLFTLSSGITVVPLLASFAAEFGGFDIIYRSLFTTTLTFAALAVVGLTSNRSFQGLTGFLFVALIGMILTGVLGIFLPWGNTMEMVYSGAGVLIFSLYALVDIQRLKTMPDEGAVQAAIALYLDIFNLFIFILRLTGALRRD
ncbi:MAG: Bax inhibitor-1/YccA family protein [Candidatus Gracilibacteria bacterium]|jgi:hypothetical protein